MLLALQGLFDTGEAATEAANWIKNKSESELVAVIDPERFFDFQQVRPVIHFNDDGVRQIDWPTTNVWACSTDGPRDLIVVEGIEPHLQWRDYSAQLKQVARESGAEMVMTIGALPAVVAHTRDFSVTGSAADVELAARLNLQPPTYQGPTGVMGVVNHELHTAGIPVISIRVDVPHYVPAPPSPKATVALLRQIEALTRVETGWQSLDQAVTEWVQRVDEAVSSDQANQDYVSGLEAEADKQAELEIEVTDLAAEVEDFLRTLREDNDDDSA